MTKLAAHLGVCRRVYSSLCGLFKLLGMSALVLLIATGCHKKEADSHLTNYEALREETVRLVETHQIIPDQSGLASLPEKVKGASVDGLVYILNASERYVIAFNITPGESPRTEYLVYSNQPISAEVEPMRIGPLNLTLKTKLGSHWYLMLVIPG
jgi:hypothetical protein